MQEPLLDGIRAPWLPLGQPLPLALVAEMNRYQVAMAEQENQ